MFAALVVGLSLAGNTGAQVVFTDDFESGNLNNWTTSGTSPLDIASPTNRIPVGGTSAAYVNTSADRMHRNIIADNAGSEISGHLVFTSWIYDANNAATRVYNEIRGYAGGTGLPNGGTTASGTLAQLLAIGKFNNVTLPGEVFTATKYQARVAFRTGFTDTGWLNLNAPGSPNRSVGWHRFDIEVIGSGATLNFYVDGILSRTFTGADLTTYDTIAMGPGTGTTVGDAWIDGFSLMTGNPVITTQPQSQIATGGGGVTFSVAATGGFNYQWKRNGDDIVGATSATLTINNVSSANSGDYTVVVSNGAGSTTSSTASLAVAPGITSQPANQTNCVGSTASFSVAAAGDAPLAYQWYLNEATALTDETNATLNLLNVQLGQAGNYTVIVTNNSGSITSSVASLTVNQNPAVSVNSETVCAGASATLTATTATPNPTYLWTPGGSTSSSITVSPGSTTVYSVTVTEGTTGCSVTGSGTVTVNPLPTVAVNSQTICAGGSAILTATTSAANPQYLWMPGALTTSSITVSPSDTTIYTVTVTEASTSCANSASGTVTVTPVPTVAVNSQTICAGASATLTATTSASNPNYVWSPGGQTTASITVNPAETTVYSVTVTDGLANCPNTASGTVTVNPVAPVTVNSQTICVGDTATLTATTAAASPTYLWSPGGATTQTIMVSPTETTNYTVTVTDGATSCTSTGSGTVTVNPLPTVAVNSATICVGGSVVLTATTAAASPSYLWSPGGETTASITVSPASTMTYSVAVTDGTTTCSATAAGTVTVTTVPSVAVNSTAICAGQSATLTATTSAGTPTYLWTPGGETTASITVSPVATTTYTVTVTDGGSASCVNSASGTVTVNPLPSVSVNSETICAGGSTTLTTTTDAANPSYLWTPGGSTAASIVVSPTSTTTYTVTVTDGATTCVASSSGTVTVNPLPSVTVNSPTICVSESAVLTATTTAANPTYLWSPGGETTASITVSPLVTTTYSVAVTDGSTTCSGNGSGVVTVKQPEVFASASAVAINDAGVASPYPASINVSGLTATVCKVTVTLNNLSHDFPDDIDIVLVGPNGEGVLLMSDVGGGSGLSGTTLTFDDTAVSLLPDSGSIISGSYRPTNIGAKSDGRSDLFPSPAPQVRFMTNLSHFAGINPNGAWSLYIVDDEVIDAGSIAGGWSIALTTKDPFADLSLAQATSPSPVAAGSNLTYTVTLNNLGPAYASDVVLTDTLPSGVAFVSATSTQGSCSENAGVVTCSPGTVAPGASIVATIVVTPAANGTLLNAATVSSTTLDFVSANNASSSSVTVLTAPSITTLPISQTVCAGAPASFSIVAAGDAPLSIQWYHDNVAISGATAATYSIPSTVVGDSGTYRVVVNNTVGAASATATLTVNPNPVVTVNSETICLGTSATLAAANNASSPTYLWMPGGSTAPSITVSPASTTVYTVTVTDGVTGCSSSASGTVTVNPLTVASAIQSYTNLCPGSPVTFSTTATGTAPITYVWRKNGTVIPGETANSLSIPAVALADAGTYSVEVTGGCGSVTNNGTLSVVTPPAFTAQPQNQITPMGNGAVFSLTATGINTVTVQWQLNGSDIPGATANSLAVSNVTLAQSGSLYRAIATSCGGSTTSQVATLTVTPVSGIAFDFDTPLQFTNAPYYMTWNNWINNSFTTPLSLFEAPIGGVGPYPGSGSLELPPSSAVDNSSVLLPVNYDFSLSNRTLFAATMFKVKTPVTAGRRATQLGFVTATNLGVNDINPQAFMSVIVQPPTANTPSFELRTQRRNSGGGLQESLVANGVTLTVSNWYKLTAVFSNSVSGGLLSSNFAVAGILQDMGPLGTTPGAVVASFLTTTNNGDIARSRNVYLALRSFEDGGVEARDNTFVFTKRGNIAFVQQPENLTLPQGRRAALKALVDGEGPYTYQWFKNGVAIPGARSWNYILPSVRLSDHGSQYTVEVAGPANTITSDPATLNVLADTLTVVSVGSVDGRTVGVRFSQPVDPATAEDEANYSINGVNPTHARIYRSTLGAMGPEGIYVVLTPQSPLNAPYSVTVQNVKDLSGNAVGSPSSANGRIENLIGYDVNPLSTAPVGEEYSFAAGQFIVTGGGSDIFNIADSFRYVYTQQTGDFDVIAKIPLMDSVRAPSKVGFDARADLSPFAPQVLAAVNPGPINSQAAAIRQFTEGTVKQFYNVNAGSWGNARFVSYPDVWLRFRRAGNTFYRYASTNGVNWSFDGPTVSTSTEFPETIYLGLAVCSVAQNVPMSAMFENFGSFAGYPGATITISSQPTNITVAANNAVSIGGLVASVSVAPTVGELAYVWQRSNGAGGWTNTPTSGATNNILSVGTVTFADNGAQFRCVLRAPGAAEVISSVATLTVTDTTIPTYASANVNAFGISEVVLNFSENISELTATNVANYAVTNAAGVRLTVLSASFLGGDRRVIVLKVDGTLGMGTATATASGLRDLNNNLLATTVRSFRSFNAPLGPVVIETYQDIGNATDVPSFTAHALYTANTPTFITYSNVFGYNVGFGGIQDNFGIKAYSYFVPPTNGAYKFWIRSDDGVQLFMNTNGTDPAGKVLIAANAAANANYSVGSTPASSITNITLVANQRYYVEALLKEGTGGEGFSVMWTDPVVNAAPGTGVFIPITALDYPAAAAQGGTPVISELYTGYTPAAANNGGVLTLTQGTNYPGSSYIADTVNYKYIAGVPDLFGYQRYFATQPSLVHTRFDNYLGRMATYFVAPSNGNYRFYMRSDDASQLYMNTNASNTTDPAGKRLIGRLDAFTSAYTLVGQNISLVGGRRYYMEALWREGGGGDGVAVAVRSQNDTVVPPIGPPAETIPASMLEYPMVLRRSGELDFTGILPVNPTVVDGRSITLAAAGIVGAPPYGLIWLKNGVRVMDNSITNMTPPLTMADNGAVYTLMVTNYLGTVSRSATITVLPDGAAPQVLRTVARRSHDGFSIEFNEPVEESSATYLANYQVNNGLQILSATLSPSRTVVFFDTTPLAPSTTYTVTINGVRDDSSSHNMIAANTTGSFSTWAVGGSGFLVELYTNIPGATIPELTGQPKFVANMPDFIFYTNIFGVGQLNAQSGLENYGARISGFFIPTNTGYYRFYIRSDDSAQLWMNINSSDSENPAGRTMLAFNINANLNINDPRSISQPVLLNMGQRYYIEGLLKEGTSGDYLQVTFRNTDANGISVTGSPLDNNAAENSTLAAFGGAGAYGNPDLIQILQTPPTELSIQENDRVNLALVATIPPNLLRAVSFQWQKFDGGTFTNIPGAIGSSLAFDATLADDLARYRLVFLAPGRDAIYETLLHVTPDATAPFIVSVSSINGIQVGVTFNERVSTFTGNDAFVYTIDGNIPEIAQLRPDGRSAVLTFAAPVPDEFTLIVENMEDLAASPNAGPSMAVGRNQKFLPIDVGAPAAAGSSFTSKEGELDVFAGGADIWGTSDQGHLTLKARYGDFDIKTRIQSLAPRSAAPDIAKAGLLVRQSTNANSRTVHVLVNPPTTIGGRDQGEAGQRFNAGAATALIPGSASYVPVGIPNAWVRIKRTGDIYTTYRGSDGSNWITLGSTSLPMGEQVLIGVGTTAHNNGTPATFAEYRDLYLPYTPTILTQPGPATQTVALGGSVTYSVTVSNPPNSGTLVYQWRRNNVVIGGANGASLTLNNLQASDAGVYTVWAGNDGGATISEGASLTVGNSVPSVGADSLTTVQNAPIVTPVGTLLGNDSDPEGGTLSVVAVSGLAPVSYGSDFNSTLPAGSQLFGTTTLETAGGANNSGYVRLTAGLGNLAGSMVLDELTPGRRVTAFTASFKLRVADGSGEPADGFSFNFASDLTIGTSTGAENGVGTGLSFCVDNYQFAGVANTSGIKLRFGGVDIASRQTPTWDRDVFVPVTITMSYNGVVTVMVDGTNAFGNIQTTFTPRTGRFGLYARTGGQFESHSVDDLSITTMLTLETTREAAIGGKFFGNAYLDGGALHLTDAVNGQSGSFIVSDITSGTPVTGLTANFKLQIGSGSADGADGFSFNFANDLPDAAAAGAEDGIGTGLSICFDNYSGGTAPAGPAIRVKYAGAFISSVQIPKWNNPNFIPVSVKLDADGTVDVTVNGTNVFDNLATPYAPTAGRFGLFARTGGLNQRHWIDDLSINASTAGSPGTYVADFTGVRFSTVVLSNNVVTYTPAAGICGSDRYYYLVSDGQNGISVGTVDVNIDRITPTPPFISACVASRTLEVAANCQVALPDLRPGLGAEDCGPITVGQSPAPGTILSVGSHTVTFTVTNNLGLTATCQATVTVVDTTLPDLVSCAAPVTVPAGPDCTGLIPDLRASVVATDNCAITVSQSPAPGSPAALGLNPVTLTVTDASGNATNCLTSVTVIDATAPTIVCPATIVTQCTGVDGAVVNFTVTATDGCDANPVVTTVPASGSTFTVGTNIVTAIAVDAAGNTNTCTFQVIVNDPVAPVMTIVRGTDSVTISWPQSCTTYVLELTADLNSGSWTPVGGTVTQAGGQNSVTITGPTGNGFYRLKKQP